MENTIMQFCRETHQYSYSRLANHLGISAKVYKELEKGKQMITLKQTHLLGKLYNVKGDYFYQAALQLKDLISKTEIIKAVREEMETFQATLPVIKQPLKSPSRV